MQPYFMPYIGYFQLMAAADLFIVYDNIKYTKKGWINRNRILRNGTAATISLPLKSDRDYLDVVERCLAEDFKPHKLLAQIEGAYHNAPGFQQTMPLIERILLFQDTNLFRFILNSIEQTSAHIGITTPIRISSRFDIDHRLQAQDKLIALCKAANADTYVNPIGGLELYSRQAFMDSGIDLKFLRALPFEYPQLGATFIPWLSIIDVMMFNAPETLSKLLQSGWKYE